MSAQVALSQRCLDTLAEWTRWGMLDRQTTILRLLLGVLLRLPIPPTMLRTGSLLKAVSSVQSYKCAPQAGCQIRVPAYSAGSCSKCLCRMLQDVLHPASPVFQSIVKPSGAGSC